MHVYARGGSCVITGISHINRPLMKSKSKAGMLQGVAQSPGATMRTLHIRCEGSLVLPAENTRQSLKAIGNPHQQCSQAAFGTCIPARRVHACIHISTSLICIIFLLLFVSPHAEYPSEGVVRAVKASFLWPWTGECHEADSGRHESTTVALQGALYQTAVGSQESSPQSTPSFGTPAAT